MLLRAEAFTGTPGKCVKLEDTVKSFKRIVDGEFDDLPEQAFYMKGGIEEVIEAAVEYVEAPGSEGYFGVLANHAALASGLAEGTLKVRDAAGEKKSGQVSGGFFEVSHNVATVLADAVG